MRTTVKKVLAGVLAAALSFGSVVPSFAADSPTTGVIREEEPAAIKTANYAGTVKNDGTVSLSTAETTDKELKCVPGKLTVDGVTYAVTTLEAGALKNWTEVEKVVLPPTITTVNAKAFQGCKSLTTIVFKSKKVVNVKKNAFKGLKTSKMTIKVKANMSAKNFKKFTTKLRKAGFKGKIKKVKAS
jgi:hypothetical protein